MTSNAPDFSRYPLDALAEFILPVVEDFFKASLSVTPDEIKRLVIHRLRVNALLASPHPGADGLVHHPLPLQDRSGREITVAHRANQGRDRTIALRFVDDCAGCVRARTLWTPPAFDPNLPIGSVCWSHIIEDHPERIQGLSESQLKPRLHRAVGELCASIRDLAERGEIAAYLFPADMRWCWAAPLYPIRGGAAVAAALVPEADQYRLRTVLLPHLAAKNIRSVGGRVPTWLTDQSGLAA